MRLNVVAEIEINDDWLHEGEDTIKAIVGEYIKIKSGLYENTASGFVLSAQIIPREKTPKPVETNTSRGKKRPR